LVNGRRWRRNRKRSRRIVVRRGRVELLEALGNKIGHGGDSVGAVRVMVKITSGGEGLKVSLGGAEMVEHVYPCFIGGRLTIPETKIVTEERFFGEDLVSQVNHLLGGKGGTSMFGEVD
jgi:hypothetical protein